MRLIDADKVSAILTRLIEEQKKSHNLNEVIGLMEARTEVNNAPTVPQWINAYDMQTIDTAPVVHARWIGSGLTSVGYKRRAVLCDRNGYVADGPCFCSNCGAVLIGSDEYAVKGRYCPNCGAKMDS